MQDPITFDKAREVLRQRHLDACNKIHALVSAGTTTTNNEWPDLVDARKAEREAAKELFTLNSTESHLKGLVR